MAKRAGKKRDEKPRRNRGEAAKTKEVWRCDETPWREPEERLGGGRLSALLVSFVRATPKIRLVFVCSSSFVSFSFISYFFFCAFLLVFIRKRNEIRSLSMKLEIFFFFNLFELRFIR